MKTIAIGWLNKCRCGNKSHTVKTARGNETALWDDDAVKCNSCGREGVIQVCEDQARVLWETDEEMSERKPMTFTKERLEQLADDEKWVKATHSEVQELARIALAGMEAEPGEYLCHVVDNGCGEFSDRMYFCLPVGTKLYTAPQPLTTSERAELENYRNAQQVVRSITQHFDDIALETAREIMCDVNRRHEFLGGEVQLLSRIQCRVDDACRAAMLQGKAEPVTTAYKLPPHVYRELVNSLRDTAVKYQGCQQLREQISETLSAVITHTPHCGNSPVILDGWVACSERMPEQFVEVLVCTEDGGQYVAALNQSMTWDDGDFFDDIQYVTHWIPLPAAPQQEMKP